MSVPSVFFGLEIAKRAMQMSQLNLQIIAHNIANAGTEGYSRQRAEVVTAPPLAYPSIQRGGYPQQLGSGVDVQAVRRITDEFLAEIIRMQSGAQGRNTAVDSALQGIELIFNEPGDQTLGTLVDNYFAAWQDLANDPELVSTRANLREQAITLVQGFNRLDKSLSALAEQQTSMIRLKLTEANNLTQQIADLNIQIAQVLGLGDNPNDLMDKQDLLIEQLSDIVPINTITQNDGSTSVLIGGLRLVEGDKAQALVTVLDPDDPNKITIRLKNGLVPDLNGEGLIAGYLESRDEIVPYYINQLDQLASAVINRVNVLHVDGFGLDGFKARSFFTDYRTAEMVGTFPLPAGTTEDTRLDELGLTAGYFEIQGTRITISQDDITPGDAITVGELLDRITNSQSLVRASLDTDSAGDPIVRLDLFNPPKGNTEIHILDGTSNFFQVFGLDNAVSNFLPANATYDNASGKISVSAAILENLDFIAAASDDGSGIFAGPGNNENALAIASLQSMTTAINGTTYTDYYASTIAELGSQAQAATRLLQNQDVLLDQLDVQRESIRGVNLDEEATNLITYQSIYEGAARVVQVMDSMLDTLIHMV